MFQEAVRLDCKTGGFAFDGGLTKQKEQGDTMCQKVIRENGRRCGIGKGNGND